MMTLRSLVEKSPDADLREMIGLAAERLMELVVGGHEGLKAAIARVLDATWQRCVHFMRNALAHDEPEITRLVGAILLEQNDEWAVQRSRYMTLETIAPFADDPIIGLPAMAD